MTRGLSRQEHVILVALAPVFYLCLKLVDVLMPSADPGPNYQAALLGGALGIALALPMAFALKRVVPEQGLARRGWAVLLAMTFLAFIGVYSI